MLELKEGVLPLDIRRDNKFSWLISLLILFI
jgi:hypothetical protein